MINKKLLYSIFFLSGVSGLIYELLWSHYLKTFLGHAAYAQSLVLCIFMGGMALGAFVAGVRSRRIKNLILTYGVIEGVIGLFALSFHFVFNWMVNFSYETVFPLIHNSFYIILYKITVSSLLIFPQTVLLGMTFPLISNHFIRSDPENTSKNISFLYFANSIGAAIGIFISGFYLVEYFGMALTISIGGIINVAVFLLVFALDAKKGCLKPLNYVSDVETANSNFIKFILLIAFGTGFSSFIYEIVWIRMLSLVLGSSTHNFEIMLCAFITGIAFGGLYIRLRAHSIKNYYNYLAVVQVLMGCSAIATLPLYNKLFEFVSFLLNNLPKTEFGYYIFNMLSHIISFVVMLPATFFAGMTFPLISYIIFENGYGEKAVGYTYAFNTVGAILGVVFAVHIGLPVLGLKNLLFVGAFIDIFLGAFIIYLVREQQSAALSPRLATFSSLTVVIAGFLFFNFDHYKLASGVYREGIIFNPKDYKLNYYEDGKTASISVVGDGQYVSIRTNGKSDSAIALDLRVLPSPDEYTASLAAIIPLLYKPDARNVAVIGLGTGLTTEVVLQNPNPQEVDTVEIESKVVEAAKHFNIRNKRVFEDKRSKIYIDDAKTFFSTHRHKYDIIISEPSNPWISGVSTLFSKEFYSLASKYLNEKGVLVQWLQLYEIDIPHIASIMKAISNNFRDYALYVTTDNEMLIVSSNEMLDCPKEDVFGYPELNRTLKRLRINGMEDILIRKIGDRRHFDMFFNSFDVPENSDFFPIIERKAPKLRFFGTGAGELFSLISGPMPVLQLLFKNEDFFGKNINITPFFQRVHMIKLAKNIKELILTDRVSQDIPAEMVNNIKRFTSFLKGEYPINSHYERLTVMFNIFSVLIPHLPDSEIAAILNFIERSKNYKSLTALEVMWLKLYGAVNSKNYVSMALLSAELLEKDKGLPPVAEEYLLAAYIVANIMQENSELVKNFMEGSERITTLKENNIVFQYLDFYCK